MHKYAPRGPGELTPEEELGLHHYVSKKMPDRLHVAKLIAGYEVCSPNPTARKKGPPFPWTPTTLTGLGEHPSCLMMVKRLVDMASTLRCCVQDDLNVYSVMEACRGPTVKAVLDVAGGPLKEQHAAFLLQQAATTIKQLHSIGVLHRDVKPVRLRVAVMR